LYFQSVNWVKFLSNFCWDFFEWNLELKIETLNLKFIQIESFKLEKWVNSEKLKNFWRKIYRIKLWITEILAYFWVCSSKRWYLEFQSLTKDCKDIVDSIFCFLNSSSFIWAFLIKIAVCILRIALKMSKKKFNFLRISLSLIWKINFPI
jgi:hypothetical protein